MISELDALEALEPVKEYWSAMPRVNGKPFRCECRCNVFSTCDEVIYRCNACGAEYEGS